ncbi:MAG: DUF5658 family protein [Desulfosporosinus sp.]|nr:DUF5658 family protein [Desulfosporosinus sp.]
MLNSGSVPNQAFENAKPKLTLFEKKIIMAAIMILVFNCMDGLLTIWGIRLQLIEESNPLMQLLIAKNFISLIITIKIFLPIILGIACWWIRNSSRRLVSFGLGAVLLVYWCIIMVHVHWIYTMISLRY